MKKIDMRTKAGRALKAKQERKVARKTTVYTFDSIPDPTPPAGGTGVYGAKYVPLDLNSDPVHAPNHYTQGGIETIDFIRAKLTKEQLKGYYVGNLYKYISRAEWKNGVEDYKKAQVYLAWLIELDAPAI